MEKRNVQVTGRDSFTLTLPKNWIRKHNIKRKQPLFIKEQKNGALLIHPKPIEKNMKKKILFQLPNEQNPDLLFRSLLGYYLSGINQIKIIGKGKFDNSSLSIIKKFTQNLDSIEITEENLNSIYIQAKDFLSLKNYKFLTKKLALLINQLLDDIISLLDSKNKNIIDQIYLRESKINQKYWELYHISNLLYSRPSLVEESLSKINNLFFVTLNCEQIADYFIEIISSFENSPNLLKLEEIQTLKPFIYKIQASLFRIIDILDAKQITLANTTIITGEQIQKDIEQLLPKFFTLEKEEIISLFKMVDSIKRAGKSIQNIGEYLINLLKDEN